VTPAAGEQDPSASMPPARPFSLIINPGILSESETCKRRSRRPKLSAYTGFHSEENPRQRASEAEESVPLAITAQGEPDADQGIDCHLFFRRATHFRHPPTHIKKARPDSLGSGQPVPARRAACPPLPGIQSPANSLGQRPHFAPPFVVSMRREGISLYRRHARRSLKRAEEAITRPPTRGELTLRW